MSSAHAWSENRVPVLHHSNFWEDETESSHRIHEAPGTVTFCTASSLEVKVLAWLRCARVDSTQEEGKASQKISTCRVGVLLVVNQHKELLIQVWNCFV